MEMIKVCVWNNPYPYEGGHVYVKRNEFPDAKSINAYGFFNATVDEKDFLGEFELPLNYLNTIAQKTIGGLKKGKSNEVIEKVYWELK